MGTPGLVVKKSWSETFEISRQARSPDSTDIAAGPSSSCVPDTTHVSHSPLQWTGSRGSNGSWCSRYEGRVRRANPLSCPANEYGVMFIATQKRATVCTISSHETRLGILSR